MLSSPEKDGLSSLSSFQNHNGQFFFSYESGQLILEKIYVALDKASLLNA